MYIAPEHIVGIKPAANMVLLEPIVRTDEIEYGSLKIWFDNTANRSAYVPIVCRVVSVCKKVVYNPNKIFKANVVVDEITKEHVIEHSWEPEYPNTMPWKVPKQVKHDDIVWVSYYPIVRAEDAQDEEVIIRSGDKKYYLLHYSDLYCVKSGEQVTMLNGWILCEPVQDEEPEHVQRLKKMGMILPVEEKDEQDRFAVVKYMGIPCEDYEDGQHCGLDDDYVSLGDVVLFSMLYNRRLEQSPHHHWFGEDELIVSRRRNLLGVCEMEKS